MTLKPDGYRPRLLDGTIERRLGGFGAVEVAGTKYCGKTWSSLAHGKSIVHIDDAAVKGMAQLDPRLALDGAAPHVIDEWQDVPSIWDAVRRAVDDRGGAKGQFILTGSSTVDMSEVSHSGAGRIARVQMRPMSLYESGHSDGSISLTGMFEGEFAQSLVDVDVRELAACICVGGWPAAMGVNPEMAGDLPAQYLDATFGVSAKGRGLDPRIARRAAVSLARNLGSAPTFKTLFADVFPGDSLGKGESSSGESSMFRQAVLPYLNFFRDQYLIEEQRGWDAPVKARSRVRLKPRYSFADPSLPAALLGMSPERLLLERQLFGNLFEELCLRDLRVYASAMMQMPAPHLMYYRDADGLEVDAVLELCDGRWAALEVKLSEDKVPQAEKSLLRLRDKVMSNKAARNREPSFLAVLVGKATFARRTPDGVYVVPITCLTA